MKNLVIEFLGADDTTLTLDEIVAQCFIIFLGGFETSAATMTFTLYELAIHPEIQSKVRKELLQVLKKYDNHFTYESLKELEYMQQVIDGNVYFSMNTHQIIILLKIYISHTF